jgi:hypothetical protein
VGGRSFSLLDAGEQAQMLEGWRRVLGAVARPGSPVVRVQWIQRSWTGRPSSDEREPIGAESRSGRGPVHAAAGHRVLEQTSVESMPHHQSWLVIAVRSAQVRHGPLRDAGRAMTDLRRELRLLHGQLRAADLEPDDPLEPAALAEMVAGPGRRGRSVGAIPWPLAAEEGWAHHRADGDWHATYWIAEWPRLQVGPDFLAPLLTAPVRTAVSVVMAPVSPDRAMREARSARTADVADAELRARAGFLQSARRDRESEGVIRREAELADGHQEFRFSGYVTVSAEDRDGLAAACAAAEHAAQSARLELRLLHGRQAEAYTWTLPLARGLR